MILPSSTASAIAIGTDPAEVFPYLAMLLTTFSGPSPKRLAAVSMMRWFAWCMTKKSMSSLVIPAFSNDFDTVSGTVLTANLNTS